MTRYSHSGGAIPTTLVGPLGDVTLGDILIDSATGWPDGSNGPFFAVIDRGLSTEEKVLVANRSGTTLTLQQRAADGTLSYPHSAQATIEHVFSAIEADAANAHTEATSGVHGVGQGETIATQTSVAQAIVADRPLNYQAWEETQASTDDPSGTTTVHGLPYPEELDPIQVRVALQLLAEALDGKVPIVLSGTGAPPEPASDYPENTIYLRTEA